MSAYAAAAFSRELYESLPELYRLADAVEPSGGGTPLLRFLDLIGAQVQEVADLADQVEDGALTDPDAPDDRYPMWAASMVGVRLSRNSPDEARETLRTMRDGSVIGEGNLAPMRVGELHWMDAMATAALKGRVIQNWGPNADASVIFGRDTSDPDVWKLIVDFYARGVDYGDFVSMALEIADRFKPAGASLAPSFWNQDTGQPLS